MQELRSETQIAVAAAEGGAEKGAYVRRIFSEIAPRYDLLNHLLSFNFDRHWRSAALRELGWESHPEGTFLDLCAGTFDVALALVTQPRFQGNVVASDFAEPMLRIGSRKAAGHRVLPVAGDTLALPLADESVNGAIVAFGARNLTDLSAGLKEVHRVLRSRSRFVILEFSTPRSAIVRLIYLTYFRRVLPFIGGLISGHRSAYRYLPESVAHFPDESALAALLRDAGFAEVSWRSLTFGVAAIHIGEKQ
jgi:demethylmenaquinone methyltransferase/2-methoxy-6-polyprenyl-1,4-benzoquinol methylase